VSHETSPTPLPELTPGDSPQKRYEARIYKHPLLEPPRPAFFPLPAFAGDVSSFPRPISATRAGNGTSLDKTKTRARPPTPPPLAQPGEALSETQPTQPEFLQWSSCDAPLSRFAFAREQRALPPPPSPRDSSRSPAREISLPHVEFPATENENDPADEDEDRGDENENDRDLMSTPPTQPFLEPFFQPKDFLPLLEVNISDTSGRQPSVDCSDVRGVVSPGPRYPEGSEGSTIEPGENENLGRTPSRRRLRYTCTAEETHTLKHTTPAALSRGFDDLVASTDDASQLTLELPSFALARQTTCSTSHPSSSTNPAKGRGELDGRLSAAILVPPIAPPLLPQTTTTTTTPLEDLLALLADDDSVNEKHETARGPQQSTAASSRGWEQLTVLARPFPTPLSKDRHRTSLGRAGLRGVSTDST
jgi:hypothetical protein